MRFSHAGAFAALIFAALVLRRSVLPFPVSECTIAVISGSITPDGRPRFWKNRDTMSPQHALHWFSAPRNFTAVVYPGETHQVWAGVNSAGFGIMNSQSDNLNDSLETGPGNGEIMKQALATCATLEDFARLLDSTNVVGRLSCSNFGVFDSLGECGIFECANRQWWFCDARDSLFLVRANYSLHGGENHPGAPRSARARFLLSQALADDSLLTDRELLYIARDLLPPDQAEPTPGYTWNLDEPLIPCSETISRHTTHSAAVGVGRSVSAPQEPVFLWCALGLPAASIFLPLYPGAGEIPPALSDADGPAPWALFLEELTGPRFTRTPVPAFDSRFLWDPASRTGVWPLLQNLQEEVFRRWETATADFSPAPTPEELADFSTALTTWTFQTFRTGILNQELQTAASPAVELYPNPLPRGEILHLLPHEEGSLRVVFYDLLGRRLETFEESSVSPEIPVDLVVPDGRGPGIFFLSITLNGKKEYGRILVL